MSLTPQQWTYLTPQQQQWHVAQYGPPPAWYPPSVYAQPTYQAPVVNVAQSVVVQRERRINHPLHLVLTLLTGGMWALVWIAIVISRR